MLRPLQLLGIVCALLTALAVFAPAAKARAPEPPTATVVRSAPSLDEVCASDGCGDCGLACTHGCCQAPPGAAIPDAQIVLTRSVAIDAAAPWAHTHAAALSGPLRLDRPPRA